MRGNSLSHDLRRKLDSLFASAPVLRLGPGDRMVVLSDLHMGNGGKKDDFVPNSSLFLAMLRRHYGPRGYMLALNGDIEDLARFSMASIANRWFEVYQACDEFAARGGLVKLAGNHDQELLYRDPGDLPFPVGESLLLEMGEKRIWLFHGHQVSRVYWSYQALGRMVLRWILHPLGVGNYTAARRGSRRFHVEKRAYLYARYRKMLALIGHTHRPLFESLSRLDTVKFEIENVCRSYPAAGEAQRSELEERMGRLKEEFIEQQRREQRPQRSENLYHDGPLLPCLFNSGSAIGRHGITAIEIDSARIALVIWCDRKRSHKYIESEGYSPQRLDATDYYRVVLKEEDLDYIFTRINLLG